MSNKNIKKDASHYRHMVIRQALLLTGTSFSSIARRVGVSRMTVSYVARGMRRNEKVRKALSKAAGLKHRELWHQEEK